MGQKDSRVCYAVFGEASYMVQTCSVGEGEGTYASFKFVICSHEGIDVSHPDFFSAAKLNGYIPPNKEVYQLQFFLALCLRGRHLDAYRFLQREKDMDCGFSWPGNPIGKYRGKRMRIDYFLVSEELKDRIAACEMCGRGIELEGSSNSFPILFFLLYHSNTFTSFTSQLLIKYTAEKGNCNAKLALSKAMEVFMGVTIAQFPYSGF
ncbi:hypothetical protein Ddye_015531 [Dipteronia dyeriana]|uniref:Uncharacterized protein n=1 Tax=Dipteronia dyeriana TaxID=168575 RepID=A0AAD9U5F9_9ROSI|nr:hypothetical protein Ddye_015531 [Dipteronia dyeriana]